MKWRAYKDCPSLLPFLRLFDVSFEIYFHWLPHLYYHFVFGLLVRSQKNQKK
jgi:hypothetical protein